MIIWLTGNTGSGKTVLAKEMFNQMASDTVILDGDDMRTVWTDLGLSKLDRYQNNFRIARLARIIDSQKHDVIVSVIAPYKELRELIEKIIPEVQWIYVHRDKDKRTDPEKPYEMPDLTTVKEVVFPESQTLSEEVETIMRAVEYFDG